MSASGGRDRADSRKLVRPAGDRGASVPGAGALGMAWFLVSLGVLFAASIVAYAVVRGRADSWRAPGESLPPGLWIATVLLVATTVAAHRGLAAIRRGDRRRLARVLSVALLLACGFLAAQVWNWIELYDSGALYGPNLYGFTFLMLTGLHALHVVGGLVLLRFVIHRARHGAYSWAHYPGVRHCTVYWHFLDAVWLVLLAVLLVG